MDGFGSTWMTLLGRGMLSGVTEALDGRVPRDSAEGLALAQSPSSKSRFRHIY
jgi:hypothetical protein